MRLTILGSGTAAPLLERSNSAYLLEAGGKKILFDSGAGTIRRLLELKVDLADIDFIFYTHLHNDHINDLGAIIWANNYGLGRKHTLNLFGPVGFDEHFKILLNKLLKPTKMHFKVEVMEMSDSELRIGNISIKTFETRHSSTTRSIIYRINHNNKVIVYTGDTEYCDEAINASQNADLLLTECSTSDENRKEGHLTPSLAGRIAAEAKAKTLVLTHFYPEVLKTDIIKQCKKTFKGKIILAKDKMHINI